MRGRDHHAVPLSFASSFTLIPQFRSVTLPSLPFYLGSFPWFSQTKAERGTLYVSAVPSKLAIYHMRGEGGGPALPTTTAQQESLVRRWPPRGPQDPSQHALRAMLACMCTGLTYLSWESHPTYLGRQMEVAVHT